MTDERVTCWNCRINDYCKMHTKDTKDFYQRLLDDDLKQLMQDIAKKCPIFTKVED